MDQRAIERDPIRSSDETSAQGDLRELARVAEAISTRTASNSFLLAQIARSASEQSAGIDAIAAAIEETARGSEAVAENAATTRELARELRTRAAGSFGAMQRALEHVTELEAAANASAASIGEVSRASTVIASLVEVLEDISAATTMLGINAAIEAAHAGDAGRGFGVVAEEIRKLAESTRTSAAGIAKTLAEVRRIVDAANATAHANVEHARGVAAEALEVRGDLSAMDGAVSGASEQIEMIATTVAQQSAVFHDVSERVRTLSEHAREGATSAKRATDLGLDALNREMFAILGNHNLGTNVDAMRAIACDAAERVEAAIEAALSGGAVTVADIFDTTYEEIDRAKAGRFAKLFDVARVRPDGFTPPKFGTRWDSALDEPLLEIVDAPFWRREGVDFLCVVDINGYLTMHAAEYRKPITGDPARDLIGNRVKRIFEDPVGLRCGRCALPGSRSVPQRAPRSAFAAAEIDLHRPPGARPTLLQSYARDTGVVLNDVSAAVYVRGEHWGAVRLAFAPSTNA